MAASDAATRTGGLVSEGFHGGVSHDGPPLGVHEIPWAEVRLRKRFDNEWTYNFTAGGSY